MNIENAIKEQTAKKQGYNYKVFSEYGSFQKLNKTVTVKSYEDDHVDFALVEKDYKYNVWRKVKDIPLKMNINDLQELIHSQPWIYNKYMKQVVNKKRVHG